MNGEVEGRIVGSLEKCRWIHERQVRKREKGSGRESIDGLVDS